MNVKQSHYIANSYLYSTQNTAVIGKIADMALFALAMLGITFTTRKKTNRIVPNTKVSAHHRQRWPKVCGCRVQPQY